MKSFILLTTLFFGTLNLSAQKIISFQEDMCDMATLDLRTNNNSHKTPQEIISQAKTLEFKTAPSGYRWIDRISNMPTYYSEFYETFKSCIFDVVNNGQTNWTTDYNQAIDLGSGNYGVKIHTYTGTKTFPIDPAKEYGEQIKEQLSDEISANWAEAISFMNFVGMSLSYDIPEAFWIGSQYAWTHSYGSTATIGSDITATYTQNVYLIVKTPDYDIRRAELADNSKIQSQVKAFNDAISKICSTVTDKTSRYDILLGLNNWLTKNNHYNTYYYSNACSELAWSPLSSLCHLQGKDAPVCEGYARGFMALCNALDIPCVVSTGNAKSKTTSSGESHMWNEVQMENDLWYAVDVTWNDPYVDSGKNVSGYESEKWFLLGSNDIVNTGLTFGDSHLKESPWNELEDVYKSMWNYDISTLITEQGYGSTSAIETVKTNAPSSPSIYSIDGRKVNAAISKLPKGIYIINGKKTAINQ